MARPRGDRDGFDTIDLTFSSPEPEYQPRQPQLYSGSSNGAPRVKHETGHLPRVDGIGHSRIKPEPGQPSNVQRNPGPFASSYAPAGPPQTRQVHPSHLEEIIRTTSSDDLRKVLLELCQVSPALSGALVRGLAPYSLIAQGMVRSSGRPPLSPQRVVLPVQRSGHQTSQARNHTYAFQSTPPVRHEPYRTSTPSNWRPTLGRPSTPSPDRELRRPGPSAKKTLHPNSARAPLQHLPRGSSTINRTSDTDTVTQMTETQKASSQTTKTCVKCHEPFSDDSEPCIYHPGRKIKQEDGVIVWTCCLEDMLSVGCDFGGNHTTDNIGWEDVPDTIVG